MFEILPWLLVIQACGFAALPLALRLFRVLPDGGYALSKPLGLLLVTYLVWMPGMLGYLEYRRSTVLFVLVSVAAVCWSRWGADTLAWIEARRSVVLVEEAVFLLAGLAALYVRIYNADIVGQEKFMDMAFFNGFLAATDLPAEDTWLAGYGMPYYPFGYLLLGVPAKVAGLPAAYAYNLALVLVFALTVMLSAALAANLVALLHGEGRDVYQHAPTRGEGGGVYQYARTGGPRPIAWSFGLLAALFVAVCGNVVGPLEVLAARGIGGPEFWEAVGVKNLKASESPPGWLPDDGGWWWHASRVIPTIQPDGITEFPYFSYLLGDLHPHFTFLPLLLLIMSLALALLLGGAPWKQPESLVVAGLALGAPIVANTWDVATFWTLYGAAGLLVAWRQLPSLAPPPGLGEASRRGHKSLPWRSIGLAVAPIPLGLLLFSPYFVGYSSQRLGIALVADRTPLTSLLIIFGPFLGLAIMLLARLLGPASGGSIRARPPWLPVLAGAAVLVALALRERWTAALALVLLALAAAAVWRQAVRWRQAPAPVSASGGAALYLAVLAALAPGILLGAELVYVVDAFGTRMNTVFKLYYHVWLLLALIGAPSLALWLGRTAFGAPGRLARAYAGAALGVTVLLGMVYPVAATWTKSNGFRGPATLDGSAFLDRSMPGDGAAIRWLASHRSRPVVLEAVGSDYQEFARVSTFSGRPTVVGWIGHEEQWRGGRDEYVQRERDVERVYRLADGPEADEALDILERYRVGYVFFGSLERQKYGRQAEERLARWLTPVFQADGAVVFAAPSATAEVLSGGASGSPFGKLRAGSGRTPTVGVRRSQSEERQP